MKDDVARDAFVIPRRMRCDAATGLPSAMASLFASSNSNLSTTLPGIIAAATVTAIALVSYTALSGVVGGGGLGDLAIRFGYQRFQLNVMFITIILLLILVQILQTVGDRLVTYFSR